VCFEEGVLVFVKTVTVRMEAGMTVLGCMMKDPQKRSSHERYKLERSARVKAQQNQTFE
jgi:hypothetical protein